MQFKEDFADVQGQFLAKKALEIAEEVVIMY